MATGGQYPRPGVPAERELTQDHPEHLILLPKTDATCRPLSRAVQPFRKEMQTFCASPVREPITPISSVWRTTPKPQLSGREA